jgi:hypothetical protein
LTVFLLAVFPLGVPLEEEKHCPPGPLPQHQRHVRPHPLSVQKSPVPLRTQSAELVQLEAQLQKMFCAQWQLPSTSCWAKQPRPPSQSPVWHPD